MHNKRVLVTGGAGFIGSELVRQLVAEGAMVTVIDNFSTGKLENLTLVEDKIKIINFDLRYISSAPNLITNFDIIYHLACLGVRHSLHAPLENHEVNATATLHLLELARKAQVGRFVYVSTSEVYGTALSAPMDELHPTLPHTVYGAAKLAGETYTRAAYRSHQFPTVVVRPFNAYGPRCHHEGDSGEVIPKFLLRSFAKMPLIVFGDGLQTRDFTFVSDTARGILQAGLVDAAIGETFNLGSGQEITILELAKTINQLFPEHNLAIEMHASRQGDVLRLCADSDKAQKILNYQPKICLKDGLQQLLHWYQQQNVKNLMAEDVLYNWQKPVLKSGSIPIARPELDEAEVVAATRVVRSGWLSQGAEVAAFEREFAHQVGAEFACAVSSCTTALHLALRVVGVGAGDEVVTVSHTFIATANAIVQCGATPVFVDIDAATFNIDVQSLRAAITPRCKAIVAVHQLGMPCDLTAILALAETLKIPVIEDAACALGSEIFVNETWQTIGRPHAAIACFSFHPRKVLTTGDGGMLVTNHPAWDAQFRLLRQHGMSLSDLARHNNKQVQFESYQMPAYNYRLTDLAASIGRQQLLKLPAMIAVRREIAEIYRNLFLQIPQVTTQFEPAWARSNWQSYAVKLPQSISQKVVMQKLLDHGIATRRGVMCCHREPAYEAYKEINLPNSEAAQDQTILLPIFPGLLPEQQKQIVARLGEAIDD